MELYRFFIVSFVREMDHGSHSIIKNFLKMEVGLIVFLKREYPGIINGIIAEQIDFVHISGKFYQHINRLRVGRHVCFFKSALDFF